LFGLVIGTWVRSWWFVLFAFVGSVVVLLVAASRDEPDWPGPVSLKGKRM
jgi:protein-S-isoprenylcysteine O-methyltransferase Ste14